MSYDEARSSYRFTRSTDDFTRSGSLRSLVTLKQNPVSHLHRDQYWSELSSDGTGLTDFASRTAICVSITATIFVSLVTFPSLYADGSFFLFEILTTKNFALLGGPSRVFANYATQFPLVYSLSIGIKDLNLLTSIHAAGLMLPLLCWSVAMWIARRPAIFWFFPIAFATSYLTCGIFLISEYHFATGLFALISSILLCVDRLKARHLVCLVIASFGLIRSYESAAAMGPVLIAIAASRLILDKSSFFVRGTLILVIGFCSIASWIALKSILVPHSIGAFSQAMNVWPLLQQGHCLYLLMICLALPVLTLTRSRYVRYLSYLCVLAAALYLVRPNWWNSAQFHYSYRAISCAALVGVVTLALLAKILGYSSRRTNLDRLAPISIAFFISLFIPYQMQLFELRGWLSSFERTVLTNTNVVEIETTGLDQSPYCWTWTNPTLSSVLRGGRNGATVTNPHRYSGWDPFPAAEMPATPYPKTTDLF